MKMLRAKKKNLYKKVSFEEWKKMDFEDQSHSYVDYDDFKKSYTDYYNEYPERLFPPFAQSIAALLDVLSSNPGLTSDAQNAKMKDRMDFNEADHPRDENGQFAEGKGSSSGSTESGPAVSPEGENVPCTGFASPARLEDHATRHGLAEMDFATKEEYQQKGIDFLK